MVEEGARVARWRSLAIPPGAAPGAGGLQALDEALARLGRRDEVGLGGIHVHERLRDVAQGGSQPEERGALAFGRGFVRYPGG